MPGSPTTPGRTGARADVPVRVAFRLANPDNSRDLLGCGLIPTALIADRYGPLATGDRVETVWHGHERVPSLATGRDDGVVVGPDTQA
jgi:hypothetical protein